MTPVAPDTPSISVQPEPVRSWAATPLAGLFIVLIILVGMWWSFGTRFYDQVLPFYDSAGYQEGYLAVAAMAQAQGTFPTLAAAWREPGNNVVLYRFFAALAGPWLGSPREGLFVYLFSLHVAAALVLFYFVRTSTSRFLPACAAVAVWFLTTPFGLLRDGVGDQRMDLSSGSAFLIVAALGVRWVNSPSATAAGVTGLAAALAALHRPILVPAIAILGILLATAAMLQHRHPPRHWLQTAGWALLPILVIAVPWFVRHFQDLRHYYLEYGPDVGTAQPMVDIARFHWTHYQSALGLPAVCALFAGLVLCAITMRPHYPRLLLVLALCATPLIVLIASKSSGNGYVQQAALGVPALIFAAWHPRQLAPEGASCRWCTAAAWLFLILPVIAAPVRLEQSLAIEPKFARDEVVLMLRQIDDVEPQTRIAGFHDLPISPAALCMLARDAGIPLQVGTLAYYPSDFGLLHADQTDPSSEVVRDAVSAKLAMIKQQDTLLILPTADTSFRLWQGLYSHRLLPAIRSQVENDPDFLPLQRIGPVKEVYFDLYRITPR